MKLSYNWINDFIDIKDLDIKELCSIITMKTCEVEGFERAYPHLESIVVSYIEELLPHPDAEKLKICKVNNGKEIVQIVTGAQNVQAKKKYPLAPVGTTLPNGMTLAKAKLRGVDSLGMLCSVGELALENMIINIEEDPEAGLLTLPDYFTTGDKLAHALELNDYIIEIDNKSITHRPDLWGHYGFARELSAILKRPLKNLFTEKSLIENSALNFEKKKPTAKIEKNSAIVYSSAIITNVSVKPSPYKIQARLMVTGMRPINNVVDVSNYVMLEMGQPNHPFDRDFIESSEILVNYAHKGEKIKLLNGEEVELVEGISMIRDGSKPIAIAGVMGGENTEVTHATKTLFLESATFHRKDIRKAVSALGIRTEASQRFEKGQNPQNSEKAIIRFYDLLKESCSEIKLGTIETVETEKSKTNTIQTTISFIMERLGEVDIDSAYIVSLLESLEMKCSLNGDNLTIEVPVYRSYHDIEIPEDIVEEIGRVVGYDKITPQPLMVKCEVPALKNELRQLEHRLRNLMSASYHYTEVYNYAFHSDDNIAMDQRFSAGSVKLLNSIHQDLQNLRISPLPGLLHNILENYKERGDLAFYEIERIFLPRAGEKDDASLPEERYFLAGIRTVAHDNKNNNAQLLSMQSMLSDLLFQSGLAYNDQKWIALKSSIFHPGRGGAALDRRDGKELIRWGQVHPRNHRGINISIYYFELFLNDILNLTKSHRSHYRPVIKYPSSDFELTVIMDKLRPFEDIINITGIPEIPAGEKTVMSSLQYLTTYEGESIEKGKKALSFRVVWQNQKRTLEHSEIKKLQEDLITSLKKAGIELR